MDSQSNSLRRYRDLGIGLILILSGSLGFAFLKSKGANGLFSGGDLDEEAAHAKSFSVFVGELTKQKGQVHFKFGDSAIWHDLDSTHESVSLGDALLTAKDSEATLQMKNGDHINVLSNTLIVMKRSKENVQAPIELKKGHVVLKVHTGAEPVRVVVQGHTYEIKPVVNQDSVTQEASVEVSAEAKEGSPDEVIPEIHSSQPIQVALVEDAPAATEDSPANILATAPVIAATSATPEEKKTETVNTVVAATQAPEKLEQLTVNKKDDGDFHVQLPVPSKAGRKVASESEPIATPTPQPAPVMPPKPKATPVATPKATPLPTAELQVPTPSPTPVPYQFQEYSAITITPVFSFSRVDSTDTSNGSHAVLGSELNVGAKLAWEQYYSQSFQTALSLQGTSERYHTAGDTRTLTHASPFLGRIGFQGVWGQNESLQLVGEAAIEQYAFLRGASTSEITVDAVSVPELRAGAILPLFHTQIFRFNLNADGKYLMPVSEDTYHVNSGYGVDAGLQVLQVSRKAKRNRMSGRVFVDYSQQNTSITNQNETKIGADLTFYFDLKDEE